MYSSVSKKPSPLKHPAEERGVSSKNLCNVFNSQFLRLLERDETGRVGSTNTRLAVLYWLVRDGELGKVVTNHIGPDFHLVEGLSVVDTDHSANHLRDDGHVTKVGAHGLWLLPGAFCCFTGFAQFLNQSHAFAVQSTLEPTYTANSDRKI